LISHLRTALDSQERTVSIGLQGQDTWDGACRTKQIGQGNEKMTTNTGQRGKRAVDKNAGARQLGAGKPGQESQDRTARTGQPDKVVMIEAGQEREDRMART
jgi:hypothetical protein